MRLIDANAWEPYFYDHMDDNGMAAAKNALDEMPTIDAEPLTKDEIAISRNLCDSCINNRCIFQYGIVRNRCDFYKAERRMENR